MKGVIASKVKENPLKSATDVRREIAAHSHSKQIPVALQACGTRAVRKERVITNSSRLLGIPLDNTYCSLQKFCEELFLPSLLQQHNEDTDGEHRVIIFFSRQISPFFHFANFFPYQLLVFHIKK
jgi:hypothetical protein